MESVCTKNGCFITFFSQKFCKPIMSTRFIFCHTSCIMIPKPHIFAQKYLPLFLLMLRSKTAYDRPTGLKPIGEI